MGGQGAIAVDAPEHTLKSHPPVLNKLSDASGRFVFTEVGRGRLNKNVLVSDDAFILDTGAEIFAWIGKRASPNERRFAVQFAQQYLNNNGLPAQTPITRILEGGENEVFETSFAA